MESLFGGLNERTGTATEPEQGRNRNSNGTGTGTEPEPEQERERGRERDSGKQLRHQFGGEEEGKPMPFKKPVREH